MGIPEEMIEELPFGFCVLLQGRLLAPQSISVTSLVGFVSLNFQPRATIFADNFPEFARRWYSRPNGRTRPWAVVMGIRWILSFDSAYPRNESGGLILGWGQNEVQFTDVQTMLSSRSRDQRTHPRGSVHSCERFDTQLNGIPCSSGMGTVAATTIRHTHEITRLELCC